MTDPTLFSPWLLPEEKPVANQARGAVFQHDEGALALREALRGHAIWTNYRSQRSQQTWLHLAIGHSKDTEILDYLMEQGLELNLADGKGRLPVHMIVNSPLSMRLTWLEALVQRGANPAAVLPEGHTLFAEIACRPNADHLQRLLDMGMLPTPEDWAQIRKRATHPATLALLWERFGPPGNVDVCTQWAEEALERRHLGMVDSLLPYGVDVNIQANGVSLLGVATQTRKGAGMLHKLILAGADAREVADEQRQLSALGLAEERLGSASKSQRNLANKVILTMAAATQTRMDTVIPKAEPAPARSRSRL